MSFINQLLTEYADRDYTPADVMSKVSAAEKQSETYEDTRKFGLQDSEGSVILVYVAADQAEEFEDALGLALSNLEDGSQPEIAELLFNLHDRFNIVNVEWPNIQADEDEEATDDGDFDDSESDEGMYGEEPDMDGEESEMDEPSMDVQDETSENALDAVIQMMAADAEAKRQEALARAAEARAREAEAAAKIADGKLRAEEEVADMEAFYDSKNEEQKEAKKLAKLAKYRHEVKTQDMEQEASDYADALAKQERDDDLDMDTLGRSEDDLKAGIGGGAEGEAEMDAPTNDLETELDDFGTENEEDVSPSGPKTPNRRFKDIEDTIKYLHSLRVQKQAHNN